MGKVKYEGSKLEVKEKGLEKHLVFDTVPEMLVH
jgi:hypothetical protein